MNTNGFWCNCSTFHPPVKPQKHHHPRLTSINHPFSSLLWKQSESCLEAKTIRPALSQILLLSGLDPLKASPVFDAPPPKHTHKHSHQRFLSPLMVMLAGYRCWPVVLLFEMCSPRFSLQGNCDRLISPNAHSPGEIEKTISQLLWKTYSSAATHTRKLSIFENLLHWEPGLSGEKC